MINNSTDLLHSVDIRAVGVPANDFNHYGRKANGVGPIDIQRYYINNLPCHITVVDSTGFRHKVPSVPSGRNGKFIIRTIYKIAESVYSDCKKLFAGFRGTQSEEMYIISTEINSDNNQSYRGLIVIVDHCIEMDHLNDAHGSIYVNNADLVISSLSLEACPAHPRAKGSVSENQYIETIGKNQLGFAFGIGILMVDRKAGARPMFGVLMRGVRTIPVSKVTDREEGFYVTTLDRSVVSVDEQHLIEVYYPLNKAKDIGLYSSKEEAEAGGNITLQREHEIADLKHTTELLKIEATNQKTMFDKDTAELNRKHQSDLDAMIRADRIKEIKHDDKVRELKEASLMANRIHDEYVRGHSNSSLERQREHDDKIRQYEREREKFKMDNEEKTLRMKTYADFGKLLLPTLGIIGGLFKFFSKRD